MGRVPVVPESEWSDRQRAIVARFGSGGAVDPLLAVLLNAPDIAEGVMPMTRYVQSGSTLAPHERSVLARHTAWLDDSAAVWALFDGIDDERATAPALLALADELVTTIAVTDATWNALAADRDVLWMIDAVETVAHVAFLCCLARSFGVEGAAFPDALRGRERPTPLREPALTTARIAPLAGDTIAVLRTFAHHPVMAAARTPRAGFINHVSSLDPHDRETLILRIGWDCRSEYEWAKHVGSVGRARDHGVDPTVVAVGPTAAGVSPNDALLMTVADELHAASTVSDGTWVALHDRYGLVGAMSAVVTASSYRSTSMSLNAYGVQLEPGDEGFPGASAP